MEKKYYGAIDGLRKIAAIGILMMLMAANNDYKMSGIYLRKDNFFFYKFCIPVYDCIGIWNVLR